MMFVRAWIGTDDTWASHLHAKGRRCYLSQNIGLAVAGSAGVTGNLIARNIIAAFVFYRKFYRRVLLFPRKYYCRQEI